MCTDEIVNCPEDARRQIAPAHKAFRTFGEMLTWDNMLTIPGLLLGIGLRMYHLGTQPLWLDEAISIEVAKLTIPEIISERVGRNVHPPFYCKFRRNLLLLYCEQCKIKYYKRSQF